MGQPGAGGGVAVPGPREGCRTGMSSPPALSLQPVPSEPGDRAELGADSVAKGLARPGLALLLSVGLRSPRVLLGLSLFLRGSSPSGNAVSWFIRPCLETRVRAERWCLGLCKLCELSPWPLRFILLYIFKACEA